MAQDGKELDANEPASEFKLEKARQRGSVARSNELVFAFVLLATVGCIYGLGHRTLNEASLLLAQGLHFVGRPELSQAAAFAYLSTLGMRAIAVIAPIAFTVWITALLVAAIQAKGIFSTHPLTPDFSKLNPATGLKRMASAKSLLELGRTSLKVLAIGWVAMVWGTQHLNEIARIGVQSSRAAVQSIIDLLGSAMTVLAGLVLVFALADFLINRWTFLRQMRMSRRDIKEEHKERDGDPRIKARLRELRIEWLKRAKQLSNVRNADVLLTNPTHYAVALEYRQGEMAAPMITARGAGELAMSMRRQARRHGVPVVENVALTRALFATPESQTFVPEEHFNQVARVLRWVYAARGKVPA